MKRAFLFLSVVLALVLAGCTNPAGSTGESSSGTSDSEPLPPYPVVAPGEDPSVRSVTVQYTAPFEYQLAIDTDAEGRRDPNGDTVHYRLVGDGAVFLTLDADTGLVTIEGTSSNYTFEFYSEDETGLDTSDNVLEVIFDGSD